jgi:fructokinase
LRQGVRLVVVTRGRRPGLDAQRARERGGNSGAAGRHGRRRRHPAALLAWLRDTQHLSRDALDERALDAALRYATRAAAITCSRRGADLPRRGDLGS